MIPWLKQHERKSLLILALLSFGLHFVYLSHPSEVVFDEFHFGPYLNKYLCSGEHYFDIHPPHPKLLMTLVGLASDYDCSIPFGKVGTAYGEVSPTLFRALPALLGSMLPLLLFWLARSWGLSRLTALVAGFALCFENAFLLQSRLILLDVFLLFGTLVCLCCYQANLDHPRRVGFAFLAGAAAALAIGTKFSGLFCLGMVGVMEAHKLWRDSDWGSRSWRQILFFSAGLILIYSAGWYLHFGILSEPGSGDRWFKPVGTWWRDAITAHEHMWKAGVGLSKGHRYASKPLGWFLMDNPIYYWKGSGHIYLIGNPIVWIGASLASLNAIWQGIFLFIKNSASLNGWLQRNWRPIIAFLGAYTPLLFLSRPMFLYHFMTPMLFLIIIGSASLSPMLTTPRRIGVFAVLVILGFLAIAPLTYGLSFGYEPLFFVFKYLPGWR